MMKTKCKLYLWEPDPTTECDICGLHDFDDKIVDVEDEEDGTVATMCADCAGEVSMD
jgi:hypothetical protein